MFRHQLADDTELRLIEPRHTAEIYAVVERNRAHLRQWLAWVDGVSSIEGITMPRRNLIDLAQHGHFAVGIWHRGQLAGMLAVHEINARNHSASLGYWLDAHAQGQGIMTRACRVMLDHLFGVLHLHRVEIRAATGNARSQAVARRLGFQHEGTLRQAQWLTDGPVDQMIFALLKEEWQDTGERLAFSHPLTEGAELRLLLPHYAEEIYALVENNRQHLRWMTFTEGTRSVEDVRNFIQRSLLKMAEGKGLSVAIVQQGRLAGIFGVDGIDRNSQMVEIGYWLAEEFQGKGLMTCAGRAMLAHLFETVGLNRAELRCDVRNTRSRALAERLGFVYEGTKRQADKIGGEYVDMHYFGLLREEWKALRSEAGISRARS